MLLTLSLIVGIYSMAETLISLPLKTVCFVFRRLYCIFNSFSCFSLWKEVNLGLGIWGGLALFQGSDQDSCAVNIFIRVDVRD